MSKQNNDWRAIVAEYRASGQTQAAWCTEHGVSIHNLRYWIRKEREKCAPSKESYQWIALDAGNFETSMQEQNLTIKIGHAVIDIKPGFDPKLLQDVVRTLMSLC